MRFLDARRLTGPNLLLDGPGAVLDIECAPDEAPAIAGKWQELVEGLVAKLGWPSAEYGWKQLDGGVSLAFTAPIDRLYTATEINEWAFAAMAGESPPDPVDRLLAEFAEEANPALLRLADAAQKQGVTLLWDDDEVSLGLGRSATTWPARSLPAEPDWQRYSDIPVGLVTGTNGKTTSVRLTRHILDGGGHSVGISSTDWIAVNDEVIDRGDWSGPGGARTVLRHNGVDVGVLEAARGGLLRRGLGVMRATASLITNIAEDHLGDFGSRSLSELLDIKWIVSHAVREHGVLVLNADDELLVDKARDYPGRIDWFSLQPDNPVIQRCVDSGGSGFVLAGDILSLREGDRQHDICKTTDVPIAMGGLARHNVANALGAAALARRLGASLEDIAAGLKSLGRDENPGRCNLYDLRGCKVLVDFAHNPQAMQALFDMAAAIPAGRRILCFGQAGDRPDALIEAMTRDAYQIGLDRVIVSELAKYHRGRQHGEVFGVIRRQLLELGMADEDILHFDEEIDSLESALEWARYGDLVIMLALGGSEPVHRYLIARGAD